MAADGPALVERTAVIVNRRGLHARAAARFVKTCERFAAEITVRKDEVSASGRSIMGLMMLAASTGSTIALTASGPDGAAALDAVIALIEDRFGED